VPLPGAGNNKICNDRASNSLVCTCPGNLEYTKSTATSPFLFFFSFSDIKYKQCTPTFMQIVLFALNFVTKIKKMEPIGDNTTERVELVREGVR
jgi:hypothetical protein